MTGITHIAGQELTTMKGTAQNRVELQPWPELFDQARHDPALRTLSGSIVEAARKALQGNLAVRAYRLADVRDPDSRCRHIQDPVKREVFALAMSDVAANCQAGDKMRLCAMAYRLTGDAAFAAGVRDQLHEMCAWSPLQRGGWTEYHNDTVLPDTWSTDPWWGGSWLGTGMGVRGIADALDMMPEDSIPVELLASAQNILEREIAQICDDWRVKRQWFVHGENAITNQWVMPTEGLIRGCIVLGTERHRDAFALGVTNILKTLDAQNDDGSYAEGWFYAKSWTVPAILNVARIMALHNDRRVLEHPFMQRFPRWLCHQFQPGKQFVQAFDAIMAVRDTYAQMAGLLSQIAVCTHDAETRWLLANQIGKVSNDHWGLAAALLPSVDSSAQPPLFASYDGARCVMWRNSWEDDADGVWIRGGHPRDQHDHRDRGHVSYTHRGHPILIECGTPFYGHEAIASHFSSGAGHNVLQLGDAPMPPDTPAGPFDIPGGWQLPRLPAAVDTTRLDKIGGNITVTVEGGYAALKVWRRQVVWDETSMTVTDTVEVEDPRIVLFRWHLGTEDEVEITDDTAAWPEARLQVRADAPVIMRQEMRQDHSLEARNDHHEHRCLLVRSAEVVETITITICIKPEG